MQKLSDVLYKVCQARDWQLNDYIPRDVTGLELSPHVLLGNIKGFEITYSPRGMLLIVMREWSQC
jgi:hypothetical protein